MKDEFAGMKLLTAGWNYFPEESLRLYNSALLWLTVGSRYCAI